MTESIHGQVDRPISWESDPTAHFLLYSVSLPGLVSSDDQEDHEEEEGDT